MPKKRRPARKPAKAPKRKPKKPAKPKPKSPPVRVERPPAAVRPPARPAKAAAKVPDRVPELVNNLDELSEEGLTYRQIAFTEAYLGAARLNATKAAEMAGYAHSTVGSLAAQGCRTLMNVKVQARVRARVAQLGITREEVLQLVGLKAGATMADFLNVSEDNGKLRVHLDLIKAAEAGALGMLKEFTEEDGPDGTMIRKVKIIDPEPYVKILAQNTGVVSDGMHPGLSGPAGAGDVKAMTDAELLAYMEENKIPMADTARPRPPVHGLPPSN